MDIYGRPQRPQEFDDADFVGPEHPERLIQELNRLGFSLSRDNFRTTASSGTVIVELVRRGMGIAPLPVDVTTAVSGLECALPKLDPISMPIWLVTHQELRTSRRIRLTFDFLAEVLGRNLGPTSA